MCSKRTKCTWVGRSRRTETMNLGRRNWNENRKMRLRRCSKRKYHGKGPSQLTLELTARDCLLRRASRKRRSMSRIRLWWHRKTPETLL